MNLVLRRVASVNGSETGPNISLAVSQTRALGTIVTHLQAHPRAGWPESPARYAARVKHERHLAKIVRAA